MSKQKLKGLWIPAEILLNNDLSDKEKIILSMILYLSDETGIYSDKEKGIIINPSIEFSEDDFHGKTTACLSAGNKCGVIPESQLYLFQLNGVTRKEAYEHILKYMKEHNIKLDALIDPSFNQKAEIIQNRQDKKGKDGFADCVEDDKTRLSNMQNATRTTRNNVLGDVNIEHTNDEQNLE